jgi:hypothetical protein
MVLLIAGWMAQVLVGSWTHLVPALAARPPAMRERQRRLLAIAGRSRLLLTNVGCTLLVLGVIGGIPFAAELGAAGTIGSVLASPALLLGALAPGHARSAPARR